jgi:hypothetical protein
MATIDSNIALGVKPLQVENPMNQYAAMSQIQNAQNQNALAQYQLSSAKRGDEKVNFLNQSFAKNTDPTTGKINYSGVYSDAAQGGFGSEIPALVKQKQAEDAANVKIKSDTSDLIGKELSNVQKLYGQIDPNDPNAPARYIAIHDAVHKSEVLGPYLSSIGVNQAESKKTIDDSLKIPGGFQKLLVQTQIGAEKTYSHYEQLRHNLKTEGISQGNLGVNQAQLKIAQDKANREQTMGTIPAGYRLAADGKTLEAMPGGPTTVALPPKEIQKREAVYPAANQAIKTVEAKSKTLLDDIELLKNHPGLNQMTGVVAGRLPVFTPEGAAAKAIYDRIVARGGFQELQDMRKSSPTGGALGNVSNQEGQQLRDAWAAISRVQNAKDLKTQLERAANDVRGSTDRIREAFNETYDYKNGANTTAAPVTPVTPVAPTPTNPTSNKLSTDVTTPDGKVITFPTPEAAALFKQKVGIQ